MLIMGNHSEYQWVIKSDYTKLKLMGDIKMALVKSGKRFSFATVERFIEEELIPNGYDVEVIPGSLVDNYICYAPNDEWKNIMFLETFVNEWSSCLTIHMCKKFRKAELTEIERLREQANS